MLKFFRIWMMLVQILIGIQFFLAGYGAMGTGDTRDAFALHIMNGYLIGTVSLLAILFAALSRAGGKLVGMTAGVVGLVALQSVIAAVSVGGTTAGQLVFGLHAINALMILGLAEATSRTAKRILQSRKEAQGETASAAAAA
ncbi:DUF6220 domain-containing protein [Glycomyces arizonensis]|uniref:DUF6220 domain-containing protein n=1 Tax=Glycomyces arizonensis TaxID=256035 RepID=UPI0012EC4524|nr:DUF6220 domain-containing protein [Glycomyces arizonensis]